MMKRANIRIKGNVQMAGFRTFIKNTADSLNVKGFAENLEEREDAMLRYLQSLDKKGEVMIGQPFSFKKRKALTEKKSFFGKAFFSKERFGIKAKIGMV